MDLDSGVAVSLWNAPGASKTPALFHGSNLVVG
jgi:hypothetical protein